MVEAGAPDSEALYRKRMVAFSEERYENALEFAVELSKREFSGAYEIRALVLNAQDETEAAVACLEEGVGFYVWYRVVADTAYEAFELAREVEEAIGFDALEFDEAEE